MRCRKTKNKAMISRENRSKRVKYAKFHQKWTINDWKKVIFSDESDLYPCNTIGFYNWSRNGEPIDDDTVLNWEVKKIKVWATISYDNTGVILRYEGTMSA